MANSILQQSEVTPDKQLNGQTPPAAALADGASQATDNGLVSEDARRAADKRRTERERQKQALHLQRENILSQRTSNPARRAALEAALKQIEAQIAAIG